MLFLTSVIPVQISTLHVVWEDNFNDRSLDDWIIARGVFSAENRTLWAYGTERTIFNTAYHECNVTTGSWCFDILLRGSWYWRYHPPQIRFMVNSTDDIAWSGYVLDFYTLYRCDDTILSVYLRAHTDTWKYLSHFDFNIPANGWQDVRIHRLANGRTSVFLNDSLILDVTDNSVENASYFVFQSEDCVQTLYDPLTHTESFATVGESPMLDNIEVIDSSYCISNDAIYLVNIVSIFICGIAVLGIIKEELGTRIKQK